MRAKLLKEDSSILKPKPLKGKVFVLFTNEMPSFIFKVLNVEPHFNGVNNALYCEVLYTNHQAEFVSLDEVAADFYDKGDDFFIGMGQIPDVVEAKEALQEIQKTLKQIEKAKKLIEKYL